MTSRNLPTSLTDLQFGDPVAESSNIYDSLKSLRISTLSIPNRLRSVLSDALFVQSVASKYQLPLLANERCGSWYIPPSLKTGSAYFKSTDGHFGQWDFSLRRLNLQVLDKLKQHGGAIIVDSTRRGKWMPDALMKTVPIWCCVMNRVCFPEDVNWHRFQWPEGLIGKEEAERIEALVPGWVDGLRELRVEIEGRITKPLKCFWSMQEQDIIPEEIIEADVDNKFYAVVLCSASRRVHGAEMSEGGYIQGAGDDSEGWSQGLTPDVFWKHQEQLLSTPEDNLTILIEKLTQESQHLCERSAHAILIRPTANIHLGIGAAMKESSHGFDLVINCHDGDHLGGDDQNSRRLDLNLDNTPGAKKGSRDLRKKLDQVKDFVAYNFGKGKGQQLLITCNTGTNLSVGVTLVILCLFFDDKGML